jgi:membrane protein DedA with SNARE-associated domain/rhodanese-related sulfurtransferase
MLISDLLADHVPLAAAATVLVRRLGFPIPLSPVLIWAGAMTANEPLLAVYALLLCTIAGLVGDLPWYWAGRRYGYRILKLLCRVTLSPDSCVQQAQVVFERRGGILLITGSLLPGIGTVAPPLAGALRLPLSTFLVYDTAGSALRAAVGLGAGFVFHEQIASLLAMLALLGPKVALLVVVGSLGAYIAYRFLRRWRFLKSLRIARVTAQDLDGMIRRGDQPVVLDVRTEAHRRVDTRQIPGAHPVNLDDVERTAAAIPRDREVIVYCACPNEASAAKVALELRARGFSRVRPLAGGIDAWVSAGGAIERYSGNVRSIDHASADAVSNERAAKSL